MKTLRLFPRSGHGSLYRLVYSGHMKRIAFATVLLALPVAAFALDYQHGDDDYSDAARFSTAERAAISVLTSEGAVSGNPDGSFAPHRTLNRAEFTKIALLSMGVDVADDDAQRCFSDVPADIWFSKYVCRAKKNKVVQGNPDGLFHPERDVNYAEATKILVELAGYGLPEPPANERWTWYRPYILAAAERGVGLPSSIEPDHTLTRGQMARLAAAFIADERDELDAYRAAERGEFAEEEASSSEASSVSSSASTSSVSSSSRSSTASISLFPAKNSFLLAGERTPLILGGTTTSADEAAYLRLVRLTLRREVNAIGHVYLVQENGDVLAELQLATSDNNDRRKWEVFVAGASYQFPANTPVKVGIVFGLDPKDGGGTSNELVEVESFSLQGEGVTSGNTKHLFLDSQVYPQHQTAFGRITAAKSVLPSSGTLKVGSQRQIATVRFAAERSTGGLMYVKGIDFLMTASDVTVSNFKIGDAAANMLADCGIEQTSETHVVCLQIPEGRAMIGDDGRLLSLYADVSLPAPVDGRITMILESRGKLGQAGSFTWTDESGTFNWIEEDVPFGGNTSWTVVP